MRHTPGPWEIIGREKSVSFVKGNCLLITVDHREDFGESAPDTRLIAAAPELLEALKGILEIGKRDMSNPKYNGYFDTARAAIAKAEG